jgi:hypothetical protein
MVFSLKLNNTIVDGNGFAFSLRYIPYKSRSKVKSIFVCYETIVIYWIELFFLFKTSLLNWPIQLTLVFIKKTRFV